MSGTYSSGTYSETYQFVGEFVDRVTAPADQASIALDNMGTSATDMSAQVKAATEAVGAGLEKVSNTATASARSFNTLQQRIDPLGASLRRAEGDLAKLNTAIARGGADTERFSSLLPAATQRVEELRKRHAELAGASDNTSSSSKRVAFALRDLGSQSIDTFSQLATGASVLTTLIQQGSQVVQVNQAMGVGFGAMARAVASFITPTTVAIGGLAALGAAAVALGIRFAEVQAETKAAQTAIVGFGQSGNIAVNELRAFAERLAAVGVEAKDATAAVRELARFSGLTQEQRQQVASLTASFTPLTGDKAVDLEKEIASAITGHKEAITKLDQELNILTPSQYAAVKAMEAHNESAKAGAIVLDALNQRQQELRTAGLEPTTSTLHQLGEAYRGFLDTILASGPAQGAIEALTAAFRNLAQAFGATSVAGLTVKLLDVQKQLAAGTGESASGIGDFLSKSITAGTFNRPSTLELQAQQTEIQRQIDVLTGKGVTGNQLTRLDQPSIGKPGVQAGGGSLFGSSTGTTGPGVADSKALADKAATAAAASQSAQVRQLTKDIADYRVAQKAADQTTEAGRETFKLYGEAIEADEKKLKALTKGSKEHKDASEDQAASLARATAKINEETAGIARITAAMDQGGVAVNRLTAEMKAQADIAGKDTRKLSEQQIADAIRDRTAAIQGQIEAQNKQREAEKTQTNENTNEQIKLETSLIGENSAVRTTAIEQLKVEQDLKKQGLPIDDEAAQRLKTSIADMAQLREQNRLAQASYHELGSFIDSTMDNIAQGITNAFLSGEGAAVSFRNVAKSVIAAVAQELIKLALINPLKNAFGLGGETLPDLFSVLGSFGGVGAIAGGGSSGGGLGSLLQLGGAAQQGYSIFGGGGLGNIFSPIKSFLGQGLFGTSSGEVFTSGLLGGAGTTPASALDLAGGGLPLAGTGTGLFGGASLGAIAGAGGIGFGVGSLAGSLLQRSLGKTGPGPMIGAGVGALGGIAAGAALGSVVPVIGTIIGAVAGGLLGGALGPKPPSPYSASYVGIGSNGLLETYPGLTGNQISPSNYEMIRQQASTFNQNLGNLGVQVTGVRTPPPAGAAGGLGFIGTAKNPQGIAGPDIMSQFSNLRFGAQATGYGAEEADVLNRALNRTFASFEELAPVVQKVREHVERVVPALLAMGTNTGSLADAIAKIHATYDGAIGVAHELSYREAELTAKRDEQIAALQDQANAAFSVTQQGYASRVSTANAALSGDPAQAVAAALQSFDLQSNAERKQLTDSLTQTYGDAIKTSQFYADQIAGLERALGAERNVIVKQANDAIIQQQQQAAEKQRQIAAAVQQATDIAYGNALRQTQASATVSRDPVLILQANLAAFDIGADQQRRQLRDTYIGLFGDLSLAWQQYSDEAVRLEQALGVERLAVQTQANLAYAAALQQQSDIYTNFALRIIQANATLSNDPGQILNANLTAFDVQAEQQRVQLRETWAGLFGDLSLQSQQYAYATVQLEQALGLERLVVQKQADDAIVAAMNQARQTATGLVTSLTEYTRNLQFGNQSPLSPLQQLDAAQREFNAVSGAAQAGNAESYGKLSTYADTLLNAGRAVYGSGEGYANIFRSISDTLAAVAAVPEDTLTASIYALETRTQTDTLVSAIESLQNEVAGLRAQVAAGSAMPDRLAA